MEVFRTILFLVFSLIVPISGSALPNSTVSKSLNSNYEYGSYSKGPVCKPSSPIRHPKTIPEIIEIIHEAIETGKTVKALGSQHSATDIICTDGIPISMTRINEMVMSSDNSFVAVGAGATLHSLARFLRKYDRGLRTIPAYGNITVGGAVATGAHGSTIKFTASVSEQIKAVEIINGRGEIKLIDDPENLKAFKVNLGLLGIITRVVLNTVPLYKARGHSYVASDDILSNGDIINIARSADQLSVHWFPTYNKVVILNWTFVDPTTPGNAWTNDLISPTYAEFNALNVPISETFHAIDSIPGFEVIQAYFKKTLLETIPGYVPIFTEDGITVENPAVGYWDDMVSVICGSGHLGCPWFHGPHNFTATDNEMAIPLESLPRLIPKVKDIVKKYFAIFFTKGILLRFSGKTDSYMSMSQGRDTCHFEFFMQRRKFQYEDGSSGLAAYQTILQLIAFEFNGRSHWGKSGLYYHTRDSITRKLDPEARSSFISKMKAFDPDGIFLNSFGRRLLGTGTKMNSDPQVHHCALLDNCICSKNSDCAGNHVCTHLKGYSNYSSCISPAHVLASFLYGNLGINTNK